VISGTAAVVAKAVFVVCLVLFLSSHVKGRKA